MKKHPLPDNILEVIDASPREIVEYLKGFDIGEYWEKAFSYKNLQDTTPMQRYIELLRQEGLDIGKGNAEFGYRMPLPEKGKGVRILRIFRRR